MSRRSPTVSVARWSALHPWRAIGLWVAFVAIAVALASLVQGKQLTDEDFRIGESGRAAAMLDSAGLTASPTESVLITAPEGDLDLDRADAAAEQVTEASKDIDGVAGIGAPVMSEQRDALLVPITMSGDAEDAAEHVDALVDSTAAVQKAHPELDDPASRRGLARCRHQRRRSGRISRPQRC